MVEVLFGPASMGSVKEVEETFANYKKLGIKACGIPFTHGIYIKDEEVAKEIGNVARRNGISLSVHAPYYINLASLDKMKRGASRRRIFNCCKIASYLGAKYVVFHAAYYLKRDSEEVYLIVKKGILEIQEQLKKEGIKNVYLCPETMGKPSQFGTVEELVRLSKETECGICFDFSHIYARNIGKIDYDYVCKIVKKIKIKMGHFSGIEYGAKGEIRHILTDKKRTEELLRYLKKYKIDIEIINESPDPLNDSAMMKKVWDKI